MQLAVAKSDVSPPDPLRESCGRRVLGDDPWVVEAAERGPRYGIKAYTGREWDPEINLYYYRARYYDPKIGRFISEDPIGIRLGVNFYSYVDNDPINWVDPSGLVKLCCRPTKYKFLGDKCHCFIVLDDDTTLGAYRFGPWLGLVPNYPDDKDVVQSSQCWDVPMTPCQERDLVKRYYDYPPLTTYSWGNTSNTPIAHLLNVPLPTCAQGAF